jgi:anti-sigma B factor antagonist
LVCTWKQGCYGAAWVHVVGALDLATAPQLRRTLHEARLHAFLLVLDLRELTSMDSSGLRVILDAAGAARREGGRVMVVRGPANVDRMFTLTGASDQVMIFDLDPNEPDQALLDPAPTNVAA